jgi:hypothetical protein
LAGHVRKQGAAKAFELGEYETMANAGQAVRGRSLAKMAQLLLCLLAVSAEGLFKFLDLERALLAVALAYKECVPASFLPKAFSRHVAEKLIIALHHLRRICGNQTRWRQCVKGCCEAEVRILEELRSKLVISTSRASSVSDGLGEDSQPKEAAASTPRRSLKRIGTDDISVDGDGFPRFLQQAAGGSPSPTLHWGPDLLDEAFASSPVPATKHKIKAARKAAEMEAEGAEEEEEADDAEEEEQQEEEAEVLKKPACSSVLRRPASQEGTLFYIFQGSDKSYVQMRVGQRKKCLINVQGDCDHNRIAQLCLEKARKELSSSSFEEAKKALQALKEQLFETL